MKILHICRNLAGSTVFPQLFETLHALGVEQTVFVPEESRENIGRNVPKDVETRYQLTLRKSDTLFFFRKAERTCPVIERTFRLDSYDLLHAHTLFTDGSIALRLHKAHGIPFVVTLRYSDVAVIWKYEWHLHPMAREILRAASAVIVLSPVVKTQAMSFLPEGERETLTRKTFVIPNGIDPLWLNGTPRTSLHSPIVIGFAGKLNRRKRPMDALAAVHMLDQGNGRYVFLGCGTGPLEEEMQAALAPEDRLLGAISGRENMCDFYSQCDLLLVPSAAETFGMVYLEAMSQGLPVLYTRGQGFDGQFPEGEVGFAVDCGAVKEQSMRILDALAQYEERSKRCVRNAAEYAWPKIGRRWLDLYHAALEGKR